MKKQAMVLSVCLWLASSGAVISQATELVYTPVNPSFGGNPLNGSWLLNNAQSQNDHDSGLGSRSALSGTSALGRFTTQLESRLLTDLLNLARDGESGSLVTSAFIVDVVDNDGEMTIQITDRISGEVSEIIVGF